MITAQQVREWAREDVEAALREEQIEAAYYDGARDYAPEQRHLQSWIAGEHRLDSGSSLSSSTRRWLSDAVDRWWPTYEHTYSMSLKRALRVIDAGYEEAADQDAADDSCDARDALLEDAIEAMR